MPVTDVRHDLDNLTLTITAEFAAPVKRIWQVYADPRQLEKVWGPPSYPATVVDHDLRPGGRMTYFMTGPEGDKHAGYWQVSRSTSRLGSRSTTVSPTSTSPRTRPAGLEERVHLHRTRRRYPRDYVSTFASAEGLQQVLDMGIVEGATSAIDGSTSCVAARRDEVGAVHADGVDEIASGYSDRGGRHAQADAARDEEPAYRYPVASRLGATHGQDRCPRRNRTSRSLRPAFRRTFRA